LNVSECYLKSFEIRVLTIIRKPNTIDGSQTYLRPYTLPLAICAIGMVLVCVITMTAINYIIFTKMKVKSVHQKFDFNMSLMTAIHTSFCQGKLIVLLCLSTTVLYLVLVLGTPQEPNSISNKIVLYTMFVLGYLLCSAYSASLTSFLAIRKPVLPFRNHYEMYYKTPYKYIGTSGSAYSARYKVC
jgi:hypothetical protein